MAVGGPSWPNLQCLVRRKPATAGWAEDADRGGVQRLAKTLSIPHLVAIGVGSTIGAGIYVLVGTVAREHTGPGLTLSFLIAGVAAALSALCYAELSCRFPSAGSAYHYSYICIGESVAWLIGWALILEYTIGGSSVARGMSPNLALFFGGQDKLPFFLAQVHVKGLDTPVDPCAAILVLIVTALLCLGIKEVAALSLQTCLGNFVLHLFSYAVISTFVVWILQSRFLFCVLVPFLDTSTFIHEINTDSKIWKCVDATLFCVVICAPVYIKMFLLL